MRRCLLVFPQNVYWKSSSRIFGCMLCSCGWVMGVLHSTSVDLFEFWLLGSLLNRQGTDQGLLHEEQPIAWCASVDQVVTTGSARSIGTMCVQRARPQLIAPLLTLLNIFRPNYSSWYRHQRGQDIFKGRTSMTPFESFGSKTIQFYEFQKVLLQKHGF